MSKENQIKNELISTVGDNHYNGWNNRTSYGYHSYNIKDVDITGQRTPKIRLNSMREYLRFKNKNVLDLGCNVGSMLHHLDEIKQGLGFDYDIKCINAANNISRILDKPNLRFQLHDFDKDRYENLKNKINFSPDIIFVLSLGSWVSSWKELYLTCLEYDSDIILEINNEDEGKPQIDFFKENNREPQLIIGNSLDDNTGNNNRKTYLINK